MKAHIFRRIQSRVILVLGAALVAMLSPFASAHYMVAQKGTLNLVDGDIYMVLSVPVAAFTNDVVVLDADANGKVDMIEFNRARQAIKNHVLNNVSLVDNPQNNAENDKEGFEIKGLQIIPELSHDEQQIVIMGKYEVKQSSFDTLGFSMSLFGDTRVEKRFELAVSDKKHNIRNTYVMTPNSSMQVLN